MFLFCSSDNQSLLSVLSIFSVLFIYLFDICDWSSSSTFNNYNYQYWILFSYFSCCLSGVSALHLSSRLCMSLVKNLILPMWASHISCVVDAEKNPGKNIENVNIINISSNTSLMMSCDWIWTFCSGNKNHLWIEKNSIGKHVLLKLF